MAEDIIPTQEPNHNPNPNPPPSAGDAADTHFRKGINKERQRRAVRFEAELGKYGVTPVLDTKGNIDEAASLAALVKAGQPEAAAALEQRYAGRIAELTNVNENLSRQLLQTRITTTVREKISMRGPMSLDDSTDLFLLRYNIKFDDDSGEYIVCDKAGNPLHHKITANPLTIEDAVEQFFNDRPGLVEQNKGNGMQGLGSLKGSPRTTSNNEDLQAQYVEALNAGDTVAANRLKTEMKKRIRVGVAST